MQNSTFCYLWPAKARKQSFLSGSYVFMRCYGEFVLLLLLIANSFSIQASDHKRPHLQGFFKAHSYEAIYAIAKKPIFHFPASLDTFYIPPKYFPDWQLITQPGYIYDGFIAPSPIGDVNNDGFSDLLYIVSEQGSRRSVGYLFLGSAQGLNTDPDQIVSLGVLSEPFDIFAVSGVGDVNGDGFDDVVITGNYIAESPLLYYGGNEGLSTTPVQIDIDKIVHGSRMNRLNDVNGDGFDDMLLTYEWEDYQSVLIYGSATGDFTYKNWPAKYEGEGDILASVIEGDFNNDGYADVGYYTDGIYIYHGSAAGLPDTFQQHIKLFGGDYSLYTPLIISGDFNGDDTTDIILQAGFRDETLISERRWITVFLPGGGQLLDTVNYKIIKDFNGYIYDAGQMSTLGDINNDGFDDFAIGNDIYFGSIQGPSYNQFYTANKLTFLTDHPAGFAPQFAGDLNGDGNSDFSIRQSSIFYSPHFEQLVLNCPSIIEECYNSPTTVYHIPLPELSNAHILNTSFTIRNDANTSTIRTGTGLDASGLYEQDARIIYAATAYNNTTTYCTTAFKFKHVPITGVSIKPNSAHPKGDPNTFYIGYGAEAFRIEAIPAGGGGPYTYLWSNGSTEKNPRISESVPGEYPYWVKMKNVHGCESSDTTVIKVENALCSSSLVDVVMSQYPAILQNPLLANLIKSNSKIAVCKDGQTMCFTKAVVDTRITRAGYTIGACTPGVIPADAFMTDEVEEILRGGLKVIVAPNPSSHSFQLSVVSIYNTPVMIRIMDLAGRQMQVLNNVSANQTITVGHNLKAGTYIAEVVSGKERKVVKLVKM